MIAKYIKVKQIYKETCDNKNIKNKNGNTSPRMYIKYSEISIFK